MAPEKHYHAVQFYKDDTSLAKTVATFFSDGFRTGEPAVIIATAMHTRTIVNELVAEGFDPDELRRSRQLQTVDADKILTTFMLDGTPDTVLFRNHVGGIIERLCEGRKPCPIRAYGEMVDLLWQRGNSDGAIRL